MQSRTTNTLHSTRTSIWYSISLHLRKRALPLILHFLCAIAVALDSFAANLFFFHNCSHSIYICALFSYPETALSSTQFKHQKRVTFSIERLITSTIV